MENKDTLHLKDVINIIKGRKIIILTVMLIVVLVSAVYSFKFSKTIYVANTSMILGKANGKLSVQELNSNTILYQNLMATYADVAKSRNVAQRASEKLNGDISAEEIQNSIEVTTKEKNQLMEVSAKSESPDKAVKILSAVSESFIDESMEMNPPANAYILDDAQFSNAIFTSKTLFIGVSALIGILISIGIIFLVEYYNFINRESIQISE